MTAGLPIEMKDAAELYAAEIKSIVDEFGKRLEEQPVPKILYHYTDGEGLRGILEHGKLWFTDIFNLNDPTELHHGLQSALKLIRAATDARFPEMEIVSGTLEDLFNQKIKEMIHYFVCCFSISADDLGQWRAYADNGCGFSIGFEGPTLENAFEAIGVSSNIGCMGLPIRVWTQSHQ